MANFVRCTLADGSAKPVYFNFDYVMTIIPQTEGTTLMFSDSDRVEVSDTADSLLAQIPGANPSA